MIGVECVICFVEFEVLDGRDNSNCRLEIRYPGQNVCAIFIGVVFVIGCELATVAQCISLEARF